MSSSGAVDAEQVRDRAYRLWSEDGCPEGRAVEHWLRAEAELGADGGGCWEAAPAVDEPAAAVLPRRTVAGGARARAPQAAPAKGAPAKGANEAKVRHSRRQAEG